MSIENEKTHQVLELLAPAKAERFKDELNFAEFPLASLTTSIPAGQKTLTFNDTVIDKGANKPVTRKLTITASEQYGLPTALDEEVILGLIQLSNRQGFLDRRVYFSSYELIKLLGWDDATKSYKRIEEALNRWISITLFYDKAWWSKQEQCWVNEKFHILESVTIFDKERRQNTKQQRPQDPNAGRSYFVWNEKVFESFQAGNLKEIDLDVYKGLRSAIAKRMYRFLDKRFYHRSNLEFDLRIFAYEHTGIARTNPISEVKRLLSKPILELESIGFLKPLSKDERFKKVHKTIWKIAFERGQMEARTLMSEEQRLSLEELKSRGVTSSKASKLARSYTLERVMEKIAIHDWMVSKGDKRCSQNPAGFLVNAIENNYPIPIGFLKSREQAKSEFRVVTAQKKLEEFTGPRVSDVEPSEREKQFNAWWQGLSEVEQLEVETSAVDLTDKFSQKNYADGKARAGSLFAAVRKKILMEFFEKQVLLAGVIGVVG